MLFPHTISRRVRLRPATDADQAGFRHTQLRTGVESARPGTRPAGSLSQRCAAAFLVTGRSTGRVLGFVTLHGLDPAGHVRCGIYLDPHQARLGIGAEVVQLLVNYAFASLDVDRVIAQTTEASFAALGMDTGAGHGDGALREFTYFRGKTWDLHTGAITRREWERYVDRRADGVLPPGLSWREAPAAPLRAGDPNPEIPC